jgi:hypothetical protein
MAITALLLGALIWLAAAATGIKPSWYAFPLLSLACLLGHCWLPLAEGERGMNSRAKYIFEREIQWSRKAPD